MAGHKVAGSDLLQLGLGLFALVAGLGTAAGKVAALGGVDGAWHVAGNDNPVLLGLLRRVRKRRRAGLRRRRRRRGRASASASASGQRFGVEREENGKWQNC